LEQAGFVPNVDDECNILFLMGVKTEHRTRDSSANRGQIRWIGQFGIPKGAGTVYPAFPGLFLKLLPPIRIYSKILKAKLKNRMKN